MRGGGILGILIVAVITAFVYKYYFAGSADKAVAPVRQTIDVVGVKNDLIGIAHAERDYQVQSGKYASMDELVSSGTLTMLKSGRDGYTYEVVNDEQTFRAIAHCPKATLPGCSDYFIDSTMEVQPVQQ
ncbi:MAG: hypothetical protein WA823_10005 [Candidatus Acidiferrales bacterium]